MNLSEPGLTPWIAAGAQHLLQDLATTTPFE